MSSITRLRRILTAASITLFILLGFNAYYNCIKQYNTIIDTYLDMEATIIKEATRVVKLWFHERITNDKLSIYETEQEILSELIDPIKLLKNGDAWIYNRDYVIFDKSSDFPEKYMGKSMREIFEIQKELGAYHYEEMTNGVENATEGKGWYVWLPEKGKEMVAWTSFEFNNHTWTIGLSTPEKEILDYADFYFIVTRQITYSLALIALIISISVIIIKTQSRQEKLIDHVSNLNKVLTNLDNSKNNFIANISHDFRNPLTIIFNLAELNLGKEEKTKEEMEEDFYAIYKTSSKFLSKINTLLELSKLDTSQLKLSISRINLNNFISRIISYNKSILKYSEVSISTVFPQDIYNDFYTDTEKLEIIISHLISNAICFSCTEKKQVEVELKEEKLSAQILIKNYSSLIEKEYFDIISERHKKNSSEQQLPVSYSYITQLAELIGANIKAENSDKTKGSVFTVTIDKNKFSSSDINSEEENGQHKPNQIILDLDTPNQIGSNILITESNRQNEFDPFKGVILIVEDEPVIREIIIRYLKEEGYKNFITASDGDTAIRLVNQYQPDLVITEYYMPNITGEIFFEKVCLSTNPTFLPFIFISSIANEKIILNQKSRGAVDFLLKPIKKEELISSVNNNIKKSMDVMRVSTIDELTGVFNRRALFKEFKKTILNTSIADVSFILIDIDHFKNVNDTHGHQAGDYILKNICSEIIKVIRDHDVAGRYGGEEFGIILPGTSINNAFIVAEKIRTVVEKIDHFYSGNKIKITLSAGISSYAQCIEKAGGTIERSDCINEMTEMADTALYYAKALKCSSCSFVFSRNQETDEHKCPRCEAKTISDRNRVEIYNSQMASFSKQ